MLGYETFQKVENNTLSEYIESDVEVKITNLIKRSISKIAFNFLAKFTSAEFVLDSVFDNTRNFIRYDNGDIDFQIDDEPILFDENKRMRRDTKGYILTLQQRQSRVVCKIQFYNFFTYTITLGSTTNLIKDIGYLCIPGQTPFLLSTFPKLQEIGFIIPKPNYPFLDFLND